jgi:hypothetical protein
VGLSLPLDRFAFSFSGDEATVAFEPPIDDRPEQWRFALATPTSDHALAVAVGAMDTPARALDVVIRATLPLRD